MKIYFSYTATQEPTLQKMYKKIKEVLIQEGHSVLEYDSYRINSVQLTNQSSKKFVKGHRNLSRYLKNADVLIADVSLPSIRIGYEISQTIICKKPVLAIRLDKTEYEPLDTLKEDKSDYLKYKIYSENSIENILKNFLKEAKKKISTKFILIIPAEIDRYLEWNVREKGLSKAETTRNALEALMKKDKEYAAYLKSIYSKN